MGEPVNLLWLMLLMEEEYQDVMEHGKEELVRRKGRDAAGWNLV